MVLKVPFGYGVIHDWNGGENRVLFLSKSNAIDYAVRMHGVWAPLYWPEVESVDTKCTVKQSDASMVSVADVGKVAPAAALLVPINEPEQLNTVSSQCLNQTTSSSLTDLYS